MNISINKDEILSEYNEKLEIIKNVFYNEDYFKQAKQLLMADLHEILISPNIKWGDLVIAICKTLQTSEDEVRFEFDRYKVKFTSTSLKITTCHPDEPDDKQYTTVVYETVGFLNIVSY